MAHAFNIAKNALLPPITGLLEREVDAEPVDLGTASSVTFVMRASGVASSGNASAFLRTAPTYAAASGANFFAHYWAVGNTATGGHYQFRLEIMYPASRLLIVPEDRWESLLIYGG